jgi:hypothetical protein
MDFFFIKMESFSLEKMFGFFLIKIIQVFWVASQCKKGNYVKARTGKNQALSEYESTK